MRKLLVSVAIATATLAAVPAAAQNHGRHSGWDQRGPDRHQGWQQHGPSRHAVSQPAPAARPRRAAHPALRTPGHHLTARGVRPAPRGRPGPQPAALGGPQRPVRARVRVASLPGRPARAAAAPRAPRPGRPPRLSRGNSRHRRRGRRAGGDRRPLHLRLASARAHKADRSILQLILIDLCAISAEVSASAEGGFRCAKDFCTRRSPRDWSCWHRPAPLHCPHAKLELITTAPLRAPTMTSSS